MSKILINNSDSIEAKFSVARTLDKSQSPYELKIEGSLSTKNYVEELNRIETPRLLIVGVQVFQEAFGSEDDEIIYSFTASELTVKDDEGGEQDE